MEALGLNSDCVRMRHDRVSPSPPAWVGWSCFGVLFAGSPVEVAECGVNGQGVGEPPLHEEPGVGDEREAQVTPQAKHGWRFLQRDITA